MQGDEEEDIVPDERVVHKLQSSVSYLKDSLLNYFDGRLQVDEAYAELQGPLINQWNNSLHAANEM